MSVTALGIFGECVGGIWRRANLSGWPCLRRLMPLPKAMLLHSCLRLVYQLDEG
jgi:hypothetical protein